MDHKQLTFELIEADRVEEVPAWNPRAEVPVLVHGDTVVCNSPDILAYLDRYYPELPMYPSEARRFAEVREWERFADSQLDAIVSVIGTWSFADLPEMPPGMLAAAQRDIGGLFDRMQDRLAGRDFLCGSISAADFAAYPHVAAARALGIPPDPIRHSAVHGWLKRMRARPEGQIDTAAVRGWWASRASRDVDTQRINWGTFRLEWLLANGFVDWFATQVHEGRVLWSTGPESNARRSPVAPAWARFST